MTSVREELERDRQELARCNILTERALHVGLSPLVWQGYSVQPKLLRVKNTGATVLVTGEWPENRRPFIFGGPLKVEYIFSQLHFHWPSEHCMDGLRSPLELHAIHYKATYDSVEEAVQHRDGVLVVVYLYQLLDAERSDLSYVTDKVDSILLPKTTAELPRLPLSRLIDTFQTDYFVYWHSVNVTRRRHIFQWFVTRTPLMVTERELAAFRRIKDETGQLIDNNSNLKSNYKTTDEVANNVFLISINWDRHTTESSSDGDVSENDSSTLDCRKPPASPNRGSQPQFEVTPAQDVKEQHQPEVEKAESPKIGILNLVGGTLWVSKRQMELNDQQLNSSRLELCLLPEPMDTKTIVNEEPLAPAEKTEEPTPNVKAEPEKEKKENNSGQEDLSWLHNAEVEKLINSEPDHQRQSTEAVHHQRMSADEEMFIKPLRRRNSKQVEESFHHTFNATNTVTQAGFGTDPHVNKNQRGSFLCEKVELDLTTGRKILLGTFLPKYADKPGFPVQLDETSLHGALGHPTRILESVIAGTDTHVPPTDVTVSRACVTDRAEQRKHVQITESKRNYSSDPSASGVWDQSDQSDQSESPLTSDSEDTMEGSSEEADDAESADRTVSAQYYVRAHSARARTNRRDTKDDIDEMSKYLWPRLWQRLLKGRRACYYPKQG